MKIIVKKENEHEVVAEPSNIRNEDELRDLLYKHICIIPISEIRKGSSELVFAVKEFWTGSVAIDILAFNSDGDIAIIECKMLNNHTNRRLAVGQIIEYASNLWGMSYRELNDRIKNKVGKSLVECIRENFDGEFSEDEFINGVSQNLKDGSFILILAVNKIDDCLRKIINYINERSEYAFSLHALEINKFVTEDGVEILIPYVYGISSKPTSAISSRQIWDENEFFSVLERNNPPEVVEIVRKIYDWSKSVAEIEFGKGAVVGTFNFVYKIGDKRIKVFRIHTNGKLEMTFGNIRNSGLVDEKTLNEFRRKVYETIPGLTSAEGWPTAKISEAFKDENDLEKFKELIEDFISKIAL